MREGRAFVPSLKTEGRCSISLRENGALCAQRVKGKRGPSEAVEQMMLVHIEIFKPHMGILFLNFSF